MINIMIADGMETGDQDSNENDIYLTCRECYISSG